MATKKYARLKLNLIGILIFLIVVYFLLNIVIFGSDTFNVIGVLTEHKQMEELQKNGKISTAVIDNITRRHAVGYNRGKPAIFIKMTFQPDNSNKKYTYIESINPYIWDKNVKKGDHIKIIFNPKKPWIFRIAETLESQISIRRSVYNIFNTTINVILILIILIFALIIYLSFIKKDEK